MAEGVVNYVLYFLACFLFISCRPEICLASSFLLSFAKSWGVRVTEDESILEGMSEGKEWGEGKSEERLTPRQPKIYTPLPPVQIILSSHVVSSPRLCRSRIR